MWSTSGTQHPAHRRQHVASEKLQRPERAWHVTALGCSKGGALTDAAATPSGGARPMARAP